MIQCNNTGIFFSSDFSSIGYTTGHRLLQRLGISRLSICKVWLYLYASIGGWRALIFSAPQILRSISLQPLEDLSVFLLLCKQNFLAASLVFTLQITLMHQVYTFVYFWERFFIFDSCTIYKWLSRHAKIQFTQMIRCFFIEIPSKYYMFLILLISNDTFALFLYLGQIIYWSENIISVFQLEKIKRKYIFQR